jgi:hypothetical protein
VLVPLMLLNHVLVGVLLLPLGWLILYAARHSASRVAWAQVVVRTTAVTVATLAVILLALRRGPGVVVRGIQPRYVAYRLSNS